MKIAIDNDLLIAVNAPRRAVTLKPEHHIIWVAENRAEAVERCARQRPDLVLMDLLMPAMDGVEATPHHGQHTLRHPRRDGERGRQHLARIRGDGPRRARRRGHAGARLGRSSRGCCAVAGEDRHHRQAHRR